MKAVANEAFHAIHIILIATNVLIDSAINFDRYTGGRRANCTGPTGKLPAVADGRVIKHDKLYKSSHADALLGMQLAGLPTDSVHYHFTKIRPLSLNPSLLSVHHPAGG